MKGARWLVDKIPGDAKCRLIKTYIKHMAFYDRGEGIVGNLRVVSFEKIAIGMACIKVIWPEVDPWVIAMAGCVYYPLRTFFNWLVGYFWEISNGYEIQKQWHIERADVQRVVVVNQKECGMFESPGE